MTTEDESKLPRHCKTCQTPTIPGSDNCTNCWEVEHRIDQYLRSENGFALACEAMAKCRVNGPRYPETTEGFAWIRDRVLVFAQEVDRQKEWSKVSIHENWVLNEAGNTVVAHGIVLHLWGPK